MQGSLLQIHSDSSGADIAFGYGSSAAMNGNDENQGQWQRRRWHGLAGLQI